MNKVEVKDLRSVGKLSFIEGQKRILDGLTELCAKAIDKGLSDKAINVCIMQNILDESERKNDMLIKTLSELLEEDEVKNYKRTVEENVMILETLEDKGDK